MLGLNAINLSPEAVRTLGRIEYFHGFWQGVETHTTGLNLLGDVAVFGKGFQTALDPLKEKEINLRMLCKLHTRLVQSDRDSTLRQNDITLDFQVNGDQHTLETLPSEDIEPLLSKLLGWIDGQLGRTNEKSYPPLIYIAVFAAVFLQISPFETGNIRLLRLLTTLYMMKAGYTYAPYISLEPIMQNRQEAIYSALKANQDALESGRPEWGAWLACFLDILEAQADELRARMAQKKTDLSHLPTLSAKIMNLFHEHKRLKMKDIIKLTGGQRSTIKLRLNELLDEGYLHRHGQARSTWYSLIA